MALLAWAGAFSLPSIASALEWSDTSVGWRYGTQFGEPFNPNDIAKNIFSLTHADGWKYGSNFLNIDWLISDDKDPKDCTGGVCTGKAQEIYLVYRGTLSLNKISGENYKMGPVRDWGATFGIDLNHKDDAGYNSRKRMFVLGPRVMFDVPGFLDVGVYALWESNAPCSTYPGGTCTPRYRYDTHPALDITWGIPLGSTNFFFQGYLDYIAAKGLDEFGQPTAPETHLDAAVMYDVGAAMGNEKNRFKIGVGYEWWRNKFGNPYKGPAGPGAFTKTPMVRAEFHF
ncbi:MAG: outer envelope protein [Proteobacteria bacterium]|nr:outer envelope protein [Pseudomonadota bacterium]